MIRITFAAVLALMTAASVHADFVLYHRDPASGQYRMTMKHPDRAYLERVAADLKKMGKDVIVREYAVTPVRPPIIATPTIPFAVPNAKKTFILQTRNPANGQIRTIMENANRAQLEALAREYRLKGVEAIVREKVTTPPAPPKNDPMPANVPLVGIWGVVDTMGAGGMDSYDIEIVSVQGNTFYYMFNYQKHSGTFDPAKKTVTLNPKGTKVKASLSYRNGRWVMNGGAALPAVTIGSLQERSGNWTASRTTTPSDLNR